MTLKELKERKVELLDSLKELTKDVDVFDSIKFENMKTELEDIANKIVDFENAEKIDKKNNKKESEKMFDLKNAIMQGKEINLNEIKNEGEMSTTTTTSVVNDTYADTIERKLVQKSNLYARTRKIVTASPHTIPVEKTVLGKFVKVAELGQYAKKQATFGSVKLGAVKYGTLVQLSEELLNDNDYNLESVLMEQLTDAYDLTVSDLIVNGDKVEGIEGLADAIKNKIEVKGDIATHLNSDLLVDLMFAIERQYRADGVFVINDVCAKVLAKLKDGEGQPLLSMNYLDKQFCAEADGILMGKPCIIAETPTTKPIFFVNLEKALIVGLRKQLTIKKSEEVGFLDDSVCIKANVRLDAKLLLEDAIAFVEVAPL